MNSRDGTMNLIKGSKFSDRQITEALAQVQAGTPAVQVCRELGISQTTLIRWRRARGGDGTNDASEMRELREENQKLREIVANFLLDKMPFKPR